MGLLHKLYRRQTAAEKIDGVVLLEVDWDAADAVFGWRSMVPREIRELWTRLGPNERMVARLVAQFAAARAAEQAAERTVAGVP